MSEFFAPVRFQPVDANGNVRVGAKLYVYDPGTTNARTVYTTQARDVAHSQPMVADASGTFAAWYPPDGDYKIALYDANDVLIYTEDDIPGPVAASTVDTSKITLPVTALTAATTLTASDKGKKFNVDGTSGDFSVFLPTTVDGNGLTFFFQKTNTTNRVTITPQTGQTINGEVNLALNNKGDFAIVTADGANWSGITGSINAASVGIDDLDDDVKGYLRPVGEVIAWPHATEPAGYLFCNGNLVEKDTYPLLWAAIGETHGSATTTHFRPPRS